MSLLPAQTLDSTLEDQGPVSSQVSMPMWNHPGSSLLLAGRPFNDSVFVCLL